MRVIQGLKQLVNCFIKIHNERHTHQSVLEMVLEECPHMKDDKCITRSKFLLERTTPVVELEGQRIPLKRDPTARLPEDCKNIMAQNIEKVLSVVANQYSEECGIPTIIDTMMPFLRDQNK